MASTNYGVAAISGSTLTNKIDAASGAGSISGLHLIPLANGQQILVIGRA